MSATSPSTSETTPGNFDSEGKGSDSSVDMQVGAGESSALTEAQAAIRAKALEIEKALDDLSPAAKADIDMMAAAKRNPSTEPARGRKSSPTLGEGISRAKVVISEKNRKGLAEKIGAIHRSIAEGVTGEDFLRMIKKAFGFGDKGNADRSEYAVNEIGGVNHTMR